MAKGRKTGGRDFKPGEVHNPGGKPKQDPAIKAFKETSYKDFIANLQKYGGMTEKEIAIELKRPDVTMFEKMFGNIVAGAANGDKDARAVLLDRLWGKVKDSIEITNKEVDERLEQLNKDKIVALLKDVSNA